MGMNKPEQEIAELKRKIEELNQELTELKLSEQQLKKSETKLHNLIETTSQGYWLISPQLVTLDTNEAFCNLLGYTREEMLGKPILNYFDDENRRILLDSTSKMADADQRSYEIALCRKNGESLYCFFNATTLRDPSGNVEGSFAFITDITDRKHAELALRNSQQQMAEIIDFLPDATMMIDINGTLTVWNHAMEEMTGIKASEMIGKNNYQHSLPFYGERKPTLIDLVLLPNEQIQSQYGSIWSEKDTLTVETWVPVLRGERRYLYATATPLYNANGQIIGAIESVRDITDRQQAESALRDSQQQMADIINFLPDATMVIDTKGKVIAWNYAIEEMTGIKAADIIGKGNYEYAIPFYGERKPILVDLVFLSEDEAEGKYHYLRKEKNWFTVDAEVPALRGEKRFVFATAAAIYDINGNIVGAIESVRDINDRKLAELALRESETRFRTMMENLPLAMQVFTIDGTLQAANKEAEKLFQYAASEFIGKRNILKDKQVKQMGALPYIEKVIEGKEVPAFEAEFDTAKSFGKGRKLWLKSRLYSIKDTDENVKNFVILNEDITELKQYQQHLEEMIEQRTAHLTKTSGDLKRLLDNTGQGFLYFAEDLQCGQEYSAECLRFLGCKDITGLNIVDLLFPTDLNIQSTVKEILSTIFQIEPEMLDVYLSLLPNEIMLNNRYIRVEYKPIMDHENSAFKTMMVILTDFTEKRILEQRMKDEKNFLRMVVTVITNYQDFQDLVDDYRFFYNNLEEFSNSQFSSQELLSQAYLAIHTFKGNFSQMEMSYIVTHLHNLESKLDQMKQLPDLKASQLQDLFKNQDFEAWLEKDLMALKNVLGEEFLDKGKTVEIKVEKLREIEKIIETVYRPDEARQLLDELHRLRYQPFRNLVRLYPDYVQRLAQRLDKSVYPVIIENGDFLVDLDRFRNFTKSLVHVFRNAIDHGIELPEERVEKGKDESGTIHCRINLENNDIVLTISDDGKGLDAEKIKAKAVANKMCSQEMADLMAPDEIYYMILANGLSTREEITDLSGRGVGLQAVISELKALDGNLEIQSQFDRGTSFQFTFPYLEL
jgi:PAS domain S-box-containing protein